MPSKGFKNLTVPDHSYEKLMELKNVLHKEGLSTVPEDLFPTNYRREGPVTIGLMIDIALNALQKARKNKK